MLHSITALLAWKHLCTLFIGPTWRQLVQFQFCFVFFHRVKFWLQCFYDVHYCLRTTVLSSANKLQKKKKKHEWSTQWLLMNKEHSSKHNSSSQWSCCWGCFSEPSHAVLSVCISHPSLFTCAQSQCVCVCVKCMVRSIWASSVSAVVFWQTFFPLEEH